MKSKPISKMNYPECRMVTNGVEMGGAYETLAFDI